MRVLFLTVPNKSHIYISTPLAWALRNAGHEVYVASQPELADVITPTGLIGVGVGDPAEAEITQQMNEAEPPKALPDLADRPSNPRQADYAKDDVFGEYSS